MAIIGEMFAKVADECAKDEGAMREYREEWNRLEELRMQKEYGLYLIPKVINEMFQK